MEYLLNFNYGRITVSNDHKDYVTIINHQGKVENLMFGGELDLKHADIGYRTCFFGSSGYRKPLDTSWTYCKKPLHCQVIQNRAFVILEDGVPVEWDRPIIEASNNGGEVVSISRKR